MNDHPKCPFCRKNKLLKGQILRASAGAYLIENTYSPGTYLVIPEAHIEQPGELPDGWWEDMKELLQAVPDLGANYNISLNVGSVAGQTQPHVHFWVVPRSPGMPSSGKGLVGLMRRVDS